MAEVSVLPHGYADAIDATSTDPNYKLGETRSILDNTLGLQEWVYIRNTAGSALAKGEGVMFKDNAVSFALTNKSAAVTPRVRFIGCAQHAIADNSYGWVLSKGWGYATATAVNLAANVVLQCGAAGQFAVHAGAAIVDPIAFSGTAILASATGVVYFR